MTKKKNALLYNWKDIIISVVIGVLVFLLAHRDVIIAITLTAFFTFLNLCRIDRKMKEIKKELKDIKNRSLPSDDSTDGSK